MAYNALSCSAIPFLGCYVLVHHTLKQVNTKDISFQSIQMPSYSDVNPTNDSWLVISCRPFKWAVYERCI